jgi:hypothetical protein
MTLPLFFTFGIYLTKYGIVGAKPKEVSQFLEVTGKTYIA